MTTKRKTTTHSRGKDSPTISQRRCRPGSHAQPGRRHFDPPSGREYTFGPTGEVAEWLNAPVSKTGRPARVAGVRISPSPLSLSSVGFTDRPRAIVRRRGVLLGKTA